MIIYLFLLLCLSGLKITAADDCISRSFGFGTVCVCNSTYCHNLPPIEPPQDQDTVIIVTSNRAGLRFKFTENSFQQKQISDKNVIRINSSIQYQEIEGFGGAFTDSAMINIKSLDEEAQMQLLESLYGPQGSEFALGRVPVGGTDFSTRSYSYDDEGIDLNLTNWKLQEEDLNYKIPIIKAALEKNPNLKLFASAWTAPNWIKVNQAHSGMFGFILPSMYPIWADYMIKFLDEYSTNGIDFWALTTGNEPSLAFTPAKINSVAWLPYQMKNFIKENLGPAVRNSKHNIKLIVHDDQRNLLNISTLSILIDDETKSFVDGIGLHWYWDTTTPTTILDIAHEQHPDLFMLGTEACTGDIQGEIDVALGEWERGERYANSIIEDLNHWFTGWVDWNLALNLEGGPTFINNFVDSPIIVNAEAGEFYKQPMYYAMAHFSKTLPRGSKRIEVNQIDDLIPLTAFKRPDGGIVLNLLNKKSTNETIQILDENRGSIDLELSAKSITSVLYW